MYKKRYSTTRHLLHILYSFIYDLKTFYLRFKHYIFEEKNCKLKNKMKLLRLVDRF